MTITQQAQIIQAALKDWAQQTGGDVVIAIDTTQMWEVASLSQDHPCAIIAFESQEVRGEHSSDLLGKVYNHFVALITRQRGYDENPGVDLAGVAPMGGTQGGSIPFYDLVEQARDAIRNCSVQDDTNESPVWFKGVEKVPYDPQVPIYGYIINFCIGTCIGDIVPSNQGN